MADAEPAKEGAAPAAGAEGERVLSQNEIDSLLGFDAKKSGADAEMNGIYAILDKSMTAYEKLPMMEVVFDRLVRQLSTSLRNYTSENIEVNLDSMTSIRFDDYLNSMTPPSMMIIFRAVEWENYGMLTADSALIYAIVDVLLGGRKTPKPSKSEARAYTTIEQDIVKRMLDVVLTDLGSAFEPLSPATFHFERLESNPRFATITRPGNPALLIKLKIDMAEDRSGVLDILLPHTTLEPIRDLLLQMFMGENFGQDTVWEKHLGRELRNTAVTLEAVFQDKQVTLKDVMGLKVGSTLLLDCTTDDDITLRCGGIPVTTAMMGRVGESVAISLNDPIRKRVRD
jgi:flagellar motor switch protein FliM